MKQTKKANYRTRGFEITERIKDNGNGFSPEKNPPSASVIVGNDLRVKENKKR